ncbi:MAG TPA: ABC transporter substrate-binding protein [Oxalobacteraceae bacterium]|nr:ABC transporter substrate-binding protein [Oxalobacteraceae bacterium]
MNKFRLPFSNGQCRHHSAIRVWVRAFLLSLTLWTAAWAGPDAKAQSEFMTPLRVGITPAIIGDRYELIEDWRAYLQRRLARPVEFVPRDSCSETMSLLRQKRLDLAWLSSSAYVYLARFHLARLLATPTYKGRPFGRAYLIVQASDTKTDSLPQLEGKVFAYGDVESFAGYRFPRFELRQAGKNVNSFFRKSFVTGSDQHVVEAVSDGLADAGSLDGFIWDTLSISQPKLVEATRIVAKSPKFGLPPLAVRSDMSRDSAQALQRVFLQMAHDPEGAELLRRLNFDGFVADDPKLYESVARAMPTLDAP